MGLNKYEGAYDPVRPCPACENTLNNSSKYYSETRKNAQGVLVMKHAIIRVCFRCGYRWAEKCLFDTP